MKEAVLRKKDAHKSMCQNRTEENKRRYKSMKNKAKKAVSKAMREKAEEVLTELQNCPYRMFRLVKGLKTDSKEVEGESDGKLCFSEKEGGKVWKDYVERIMNEENYWDHNVEADAVEGPVVCVGIEEMLQALNEMKRSGPSEVSLKLIAASGGVGIQMMTEICQRVLCGFGMPVEWALSIVAPIFKGKCNIRTSSCYEASCAWNEGGDKGVSKKAS